MFVIVNRLLLLFVVVVLDVFVVALRRTRKTKKRKRKKREVLDLANKHVRSFSIGRAQYVLDIFATKKTVV